MMMRRRRMIRRTGRQMAVEEVWPVRDWRENARPPEVSADGTTPPPTDRSDDLPPADR